MISINLYEATVLVALSGGSAPMRRHNFVICAEIEPEIIKSNDRVTDSMISRISSEIKLGSAHEEPGENDEHRTRGNG
jgi:hypothetical protein